ncbi:multicopper oxidase-domain-containing protein [Aspergillus alliaceus]|uniref:Multicopper oxidase-domain-containing protein n=1 Tax=Petromyces alliaceus TaxID=209559 RepID=A0A5N7CJY5_PETAA|nr:multicopper oxidase-domain-containing protein [Aspergillus alliaceus]
MALFGLQFGATCAFITVQGVLGALRTFNFTVHSAQRSPDLYPREVYLINGQQPGPTIELDEGDDVEAFVRNELPVNTTIHWHEGILQHGTQDMDGVPGVTQYPIPPRRNFTYRFSLENGCEREKMLQAERGSFSLLLIDWTHDLSDTIFERYIQTAAFPNCVDTVLANRLGRVECLPKYMLDAGSGLGLSVGSTATSHTSASAIQTAFTEMDSNGNASDSLYGNGTVWEGGEDG